MDLPYYICFQKNTIMRYISYRVFDRYFLVFLEFKVILAAVRPAAHNSTIPNMSYLFVPQVDVGAEAGESEEAGQSTRHTGVHAQERVAIGGGGFCQFDNPQFLTQLFKCDFSSR